MTIEFDGQNNKITRDTAGSIKVDRKTSDGDIVELQKDGTTVGSISSNSGVAINIDSGGDRAGLALTGGNIQPRKNGSQSDNTITLGTSSYRFADLYLGGNIYLGGTGSANALDDYEEGTWTPTLLPASGSITVNTSNDTLFYTKIGKMVFISGRLRVSAISSPSGTTDMGGLPFAIANLTDEAEKGQIAMNTFGVNLDASTISIFLDPQASDTKLRPLQQKDDANWSGLDASGFSVGDYIAFSGFYITN